MTRVKKILSGKAQKLITGFNMFLPPDESSGDVGAKAAIKEPRWGYYPGNPCYWPLFYTRTDGTKLVLTKVKPYPHAYKRVRVRHGSHGDSGNPCASWTRDLDKEFQEREERRRMGQLSPCLDVDSNKSSPMVASPNNAPPVLCHDPEGEKKKKKRKQPEPEPADEEAEDEKARAARKDAKKAAKQAEEEAAAAGGPDGCEDKKKREGGKTVSNFLEENWTKALAILNGEEARNGSLSGHFTVSSAPDVADSLKQPKDQGWGELLDERLVEPGDTICPPSRSENKGRSAVVQSNGTLRENGVDVAWIDPVAFCVRNNDWKESGSYLKDRNRFLRCIRVGAKSREEEKLSELKEKLSDLKEETRKSQRGSQGDEEVPKNSSDTSHLTPVKGAIVMVRLENEHGAIEWQVAKLTKYIKETGEWEIKLDVCDGSSRRKSRVLSPGESQGQCRGCCECVFKLAPNDRGW